MAFRSVLDKTFRYRNAVSTDIRRTFERIRREQRLARRGAGDGEPTAKAVAALRPVSRRA